MTLMPAALNSAALSAETVVSVMRVWIRSTGHMRANAWPPIFDPSAMTRPCRHELVDGGLAFVVGGGTKFDVDGVDAQKHHVEGDFTEDRGRQWSYQFIGLGPHDTTDDHDLDVRPNDHLVGDVECVGDDGQRRGSGRGDEVGAHGQGTGHFGDGGAAVETDDHPGGHEAGRGGSYAVFLLDTFGGLVPQWKVVGDAAGDGSTTGSGDHLLL